MSWSKNGATSSRPYSSTASHNKTRVTRLHTSQEIEDLLRLRPGKSRIVVVAEKGQVAVSIMAALWYNMPKKEAALNIFGQWVTVTAIELSDQQIIFYPTNGYINLIKLSVSCKMSRLLPDQYLDAKVTDFVYVEPERTDSADSDYWRRKYGRFSDKQIDHNNVKFHSKSSFLCKLTDCENLSSVYLCTDKDRKGEWIAHQVQQVMKSAIVARIKRQKDQNDHGNITVTSDDSNVDDIFKRVHFDDLSGNVLRRAMGATTVVNLALAMADKLKQENDRKYGGALSAYLRDLTLPRIDLANITTISIGLVHTAMLVRAYSVSTKQRPTLLTMTIRGSANRAVWMTDESEWYDTINEQKDTPARKFELKQRDINRAISLGEFETYKVETDHIEAAPCALNTFDCLAILSDVMRVAPHNAAHLTESIYLATELTYPRTDSTKYSKETQFLQKLQNLRIFWDEYQCATRRWGYGSVGYFRKDIPLLLDLLVTVIKGIIADGGVLASHIMEKGHGPIYPQPEHFTSQRLLKLNSVNKDGEYEEKQKIDVMYVLTMYFLATLMPDREYTLQKYQIHVCGETFEFEHQVDTNPAESFKQAFPLTSNIPSTVFQCLRTNKLDRAAIGCLSLQGTARQNSGLHCLVVDNRLPKHMTNAKMCKWAEALNIGTNCSITNYFGNMVSQESQLMQASTMNGPSQLLCCTEYGSGVASLMSQCCPPLHELRTALEGDLTKVASTENTQQAVEEAAAKYRPIIDARNREHFRQLRENIDRIKRSEAVKRNFGHLKPVEYREFIKCDQGHVMLLCANKQRQREGLNTRKIYEKTHYVKCEPCEIEFKLITKFEKDTAELLPSGMSCSDAACNFETIIDTGTGNEDGSRAKRGTSNHDDNNSIFSCVACEHRSAQNDNLD